MWYRHFPTTYLNDIATGWLALVRLVIAKTKKLQYLEEIPVWPIMVSGLCLLVSLLVCSHRADILLIFPNKFAFGKSAVYYSSSKEDEFLRNLIHTLQKQSKIIFKHLHILLQNPQWHIQKQIWCKFADEDLSAETLQIYVQHFCPVWTYPKQKLEGTERRTLQPPVVLAIFEGPTNHTFMAYPINMSSFEWWETTTVTWPHTHVAGLDGSF